MERPVDTIECVFAVDDGYCQHLAVALISLAENNRRNDVHVTVISRDIAGANQQALRDMLRPYDRVTLAFHEIDAEMVEHLPTKIHLTVETYFRLFLPDIMPAALDRVLYLDADLVVLGDLLPLWTTELGDAPVAAAPDPFGDDTNARLSLPPDNPVFNAGVLLMNLAVWRREGLRAICVDYAIQNEGLLKYCDQDALNAVLAGRVHWVPYVFNFQSRTNREDVTRMGVRFEQGFTNNQTPRIVHYSSPSKPWRYRDDAPLERYYLRYLRKTPWAEIGQPDRSVEQMIRRHLGPRLGPGIRDILNRVAGRTAGSS